jgi:drug/metabolite transporter (DMT)-like permease
MLAASVANAAMAASIKLASQHGVPVGQILFYRGVISVVLMYSWLYKLHVPLATPHLKAHLRRGVIGFAGMITFVAAVALLPLATAVTLNYTSPVILASILLLVHRERLQPFTIVSMLGGLGGVVLLLRPTYDSSQALGGAVALLSALLGAVVALNIRALGRLAEPPPRTVLYFSVCVTIGALPFFLLSHPESLSIAGAVYVILSGVTATIGQVFQTHAYQRGHTILVSLLGYSQVVFTTLLGIVIWDQKPAMTSWLGMLLVIASGAMATLRIRSAPVPTPASAPGGPAMTPENGAKGARLYPDR